MQLSKEHAKLIDELLDSIDVEPWNVGLQEKIERARESLFAQADARPVAWHDRATGNVYPLLGEGERYAAGVRQLEPLYTHPEASAPGLSDEAAHLYHEALRISREHGFATLNDALEAAILARAATASPDARIEELRKGLFEARDAMRVMSNWVKQSDPAGHSWGVRMVDRANAVLSGANAATVAEPTVVRGARVCSISDIECTKQCGAICHHEATQQQAESQSIYQEQVGNGLWQDVPKELHDAIKDGRVRGAVRTVRVTQQAEPGADERAAFGWLIENGKSAGNGLAYRCMNHGAIEWTEDPNKALRFARRMDAEAFSQEDEDAWRVVEHGWHEPVATEPFEFEFKWAAWIDIFPTMPEDMKAAYREVAAQFFEYGRAAQSGQRAGVAEDAKAMAQKFLGWRLPDDFYPDCFVTFDRARAAQFNNWPTGTNILSADQAEAMFRFVLGESNG